jgi:tetratricopeptide (TPR) repeat protein
LTLFPDEDKLNIHNMRRSIAESYAKLGDYEQSDSEFEKLVQDYPDNLWGYIGWGDMYFRDKKDRDKAKKLYIKALAVADEDDIMVVQERLEDIGADR